MFATWSTTATTRLLLLLSSIKIKSIMSAVYTGFENWALISFNELKQINRCHNLKYDDNKYLKIPCCKPITSKM